MRVGRPRAGTRQPLAASAASRYTLGAYGVSAARPGAGGEPDHRLALRARRRGRCAPVPHRVGQPLAAIAASRYALGANGVGAARPGAGGSLIASSRYALGTKGVGATRPSAHMCTPGCARCLLGMVGMSKTSCAARCLTCSVQGLLRAPAEGEGGVARREDLTATAAATLERSAGTVAHGTRAARERLGRRAKVSRGRRPRRPRAVGALWGTRARAARIQTAWVPGLRGKRLRPFTSSRLPSELGKYYRHTHYNFASEPSFSVPSTPARPAAQRPARRARHARARARVRG